MEKNLIIGIDSDVSKIALTVLTYPEGKLIKSISLKRKGLGWNFRSLDDLILRVEKFTIRYADLDRVKMVAIEDYGHSFVPRTGNFKGEVVGSLKAFFYSARVPIFFSGSEKIKKKKKYISKVMISPSRVKKFFYGKGNAKAGKSSKGFLIAYKKFGLEFVDDDALDSFIIAELCRDVLLTEEGLESEIGRKLNVKEKEVVDDLIKGRQMEINGKIVRSERA